MSLFKIIKYDKYNKYDVAVPFECYECGDCCRINPPIQKYKKGVASRMKVKSEGAFRLSIAIGTVFAGVPLLLFFVDLSNGETELSASHWLILIVTNVVLFLIGFGIVQGIHWVYCGFKKEKGKPVKKITVIMNDGEERIYQDVGEIKDNYRESQWEIFGSSGILAVIRKESIKNMEVEDIKE